MIRVGLVVDEFFGGWRTAIGGFGFLAREFVAKYIPNEDISIDVLLNRWGNLWFARKKVIDGITLYKLPRSTYCAKRWLAHKNYDIYLSIEMSTDVLELEENPDKKMILWVQAPIPQYVWENVIAQMQSITDHSFYNQKLYDLVHQWSENGKVIFATQGRSLNQLAIDLYRLDPSTEMQYLPNPIDIDFTYYISGKRNSVVFLGRLAAIKRAWLFCEIAKRMPDIDFYVLGKIQSYQQENSAMLQPYMDGTIPNLHCLGHQEGAMKRKYLREAKVLVSTSIWEGIPISWLEALSYGTLIVSCLNKEGLPERFGKYVGEIQGDGFDDVERFVPAIRELLTDDEQYYRKAEAAITYIRETHSIANFQQAMRKLIIENVPR